MALLTHAGNAGWLSDAGAAAGCQSAVWPRDASAGSRATFGLTPPNVAFALQIGETPGSSSMLAGRLQVPQAHARPPSTTMWVGFERSIFEFDHTCPPMFTSPLWPRMMPSLDVVPSVRST